jgi:hypothetical protein
VQGLSSDRIQTIVRSRNHDSFDEIAEITLEKESAIVSKNEKHRGRSMSSEILKCSNCIKSGHVASRCYLKSKRDISFYNFSLRDRIQGPSRDVICFNCRKKGHVSQECKKDSKGSSRQGPGNMEVMLRETSVDHWETTADRRYSLCSRLYGSRKTFVPQAKSEHMQGR